jgi:NAD-dependent deacetylase
VTDASPLHVLTESLRAARRGLILVVTGAGISAPSGLATFRGSEPDAIWNESDVELATEALFRRDPVRHWRWYVERFDGILSARPNPAHRALVALEGWQRDRSGELLVVTQNIDTLHEAAGQERLVKVHGTADRLRCSRRGCELGAPFGSLPIEEAGLEPLGETVRSGADDATLRPLLPRCPACEALLRPHALFFDETYDSHADYRWDEVQRAVDRAHLTLFVGTSFSVGVTDLAVRSALFAKTPALAIDPAGSRSEGDAPGVRCLAAPAEELLPAACERLGVGFEAPTKAKAKATETLS